MASYLLPQDQFLLHSGKIGLQKSLLFLQFPHHLVLSLHLGYRLYYWSKKISKCTWVVRVATCWMYISFSSLASLAI